jgi:beta-lactamase regulating signal transducer with metallopeptidase domain
MTPAEWLQFLLSYSVQAALVIGVAFGLDQWSHRASTAQSRVWTACYVTLLGVLAAGLLLPRMVWLHPWSEISPSGMLIAAEVENVLGKLILATWLLGAGVVVMRCVIEFLRVQRFIASCPAVSTDSIERIRLLFPEEVLKQGGRAIEVRLSPEDMGPFCYQFHQPFIFVTRSLMDGEEAELRHVLDHELTHLRTEHPLQLCLQKMVQTVLWFHPLVWMAAGRASLVREFVCDDAATHCQASTASYLRTLLRIVEHRNRAHSELLTIGRSIGEVRRRAERLVQMMGDSDFKPRSKPVLGVAMMGVVASQLWLPTNPLDSSQSLHSPWPTWSAATLHTLNVSVADYQPFDEQTQIHELRQVAENE